MTTTAKAATGPSKSSSPPRTGWRATPATSSAPPTRSCASRRRPARRRIGLDEVQWFRIMTQARTLSDSIEAGCEDHVIAQEATALRDLLRTVV